VASEGNLKATNENLRRQCASWEATAKSTDEKLKKTEQQRYAAEEQRREAEIREEHDQKQKDTEKELEQLRGFKSQILDVTASLEDALST
jgi:hypothetical protein